MRIGVDYYPEHWDRALWENDAEQMKEAGVQVVRMAEFAWSRLEPEEGRYDFLWLDEAIQLFAERNIQVVLCTPTCTPPQWAFEKYPEIIQTDKSNHKISIGIRGHRCMMQPVFRRLAEKIIRYMVSRYKGNDAVVGYQIDNELEANHCCCSVCAEGFREYVRKKYGSIEQVNRAYGNNVWSGEYSSFSQITPPFGMFQTWLNPSYQLDFNRYASESTVDYVRFQEQLIRSIDKKAFVTTNNWLCENMPDFYETFETLDFVAYDNYPTTVLPENKEELYSHSFHLDLMRGIKQKNFWIMEQLSGGLGSWTPMSPTLQPGMLAGYSMQAFAHGADTVVHFRWRTAVSGAEMFWHGLIDHSNVPGRRYEEFCGLCKKAEKLEEIQGARFHNRVALLYSSEQEYAFKIQPQVEGMHYFTQLKAYHDAFTAWGVGVDIINWTQELSEYDIVVAPTMFITKESITMHLTGFVEQGGHLLLTNRSGVKDENNRCIMQSLPTVFSHLTGAVVEEYNPIGLRNEKMKVHFKKQTEDITGSLWCDILKCHGAEPLVSYGENFYKDCAAITENIYKKGKVYYAGTLLNRQGCILLAEYMLKAAQIPYVKGLPLGVERTVRYKESNSWQFFFNNTMHKQVFCYEVTGEKKAGIRKEMSLEPFEMRIEAQQQ